MLALKKVVLILMMAFYFLAGVNHFINAQFYIKIIPPYIPLPITTNLLSGIVEVLLAALLFPVKTRKWAGYAIIILLLLFIPAHIFMIEKTANGAFTLGDLTITPVIAWIRLPFQLLLILWAFWCSKMRFSLC